jgi:hypothetical protein
MWVHKEAAVDIALGIIEILAYFLTLLVLVAAGLIFIFVGMSAIGLYEVLASRASVKTEKQVHS